MSIAIVRREPVSTLALETETALRSVLAPECGSSADDTNELGIRDALVRDSDETLAATHRAWLDRASLSVRGVDRWMAALVDRVGPCWLPPPSTTGHLEALIRAIVMQQLTPRGAEAIFARVVALFPGREFPAPDELLAIPHDRLRGAGLSPGKLVALRSLCTRVASGMLDLDAIAARPDADVVDELSTLPGLGPWTVQMFLLFHLGRRDVWPVTDLALRRALVQLYAPPVVPDERVLERVGEVFRPHRSVASWYLWRSLDEAG